MYHDLDDHPESQPYTHKYDLVDLKVNGLSVVASFTYFPAVNGTIVDPYEPSEVVIHEFFVEQKEFEDSGVTEEYLQGSDFFELMREAAINFVEYD